MGQKEIGTSGKEFHARPVQHLLIKGPSIVSVDFYGGKGAIVAVGGGTGQLESRPAMSVVMDRIDHRDVAVAIELDVIARQE